MSHKTVITHLREKVEARNLELRELTAWKEVQVNKLDLIKQLLKESKAQVKALKKILKDKEERSRRQSVTSVKLRRMPCKSTMTSTPS